MKHDLHLGRFAAISLLGIVACGAGLHAGAASAPVAGYTLVRSLGGIEEYRLDVNGLTVLILKDNSVPVASFNVTYLVGSRHESPGTTGSAHLLEHLMYKGSEGYNRDKGNDIKSFLRVSGARFNGSTSTDRTNYYASMDKSQLEAYVALEADRMRNAWLRDADRKDEMTVVRNEYERGENDPASTLSKEVMAMAFIAHPYHNPTIGWRSDIENVPMVKLREFYDTYYWPNNATAILVGDVETAAGLALIKKYFGGFPASPNPVRETYTLEPAQTGARRVLVKRAGELGVVMISYRVPNAVHADTPALELLGDILTSHSGERLKKSLIEQGLVLMGGAGNSSMKEAGLFSFHMSLAPNATHAQVEEICLRELARVKEEGVTPEELSRAVRKRKAIEALNRDWSGDMANMLSEMVAQGDWTLYVTSRERMARVTLADVQRVAREYLHEDRSITGWYVPVKPDSTAK